MSLYGSLSTFKIGKEKTTTIMTQKVYTVNGMKCPHCEAHVADSVKALAGVSDAKADHDACTLTVDLDETQVSDEQIQEAVNSLGRYELTL